VKTALKGLSEVASASKRLLLGAADEAAHALSAIERELLRSGKEAYVAGRKVVKRNQTFDPRQTDALGRSNTARMREGLSPVGKDGNPLELHHMQQKNDGVIMEMTRAEHRSNSADLHRYRQESEIDREGFNLWKRNYWKQRSEDFNNG